MRLLAIETATWLASVAVVDADRVVAEWEQHTRGQHAALLLPAVRNVLRQCEGGLEQLDAIAVSVGPGSFTGLRVGLSVAKGLAYARKLPLIGVPTLHVTAHAAPVDADCVVAALDARKGELYAAVFQRVGATLQPVRPEQLVSFSELVDTLPRPCVVIGDAVETYGERFRQCLGTQGQILPFPEWAPRARWVAKLAAEQSESNVPRHLWPEEPHYVRPPEAQVHRGPAA